MNHARKRTLKKLTTSWTINLQRFQLRTVINKQDNHNTLYRQHSTNRLKQK